MCSICCRIYGDIMNGRIVWLTGNSGAGKTTLAKLLCKKLHNWINLDGDEMRASISLGAGFSREDREEHNLRVARLAKVLSEAGHNVVVSVIAPFERTRQKINEIIDVNWVYMARTLNLNGDHPYEPPEMCVPVDVDNMTVEQELNHVVHQLRLFNVFVLGLPRSGTSMMTKCVELLGVDMYYDTENEKNKTLYEELYKHRFGSQYHPNKDGFFELSKDYIHGRLKILGHCYSGCKIIAPIGWYDAGVLCKGYSKVVLMTRDVEEIRQSQEAFYSKHSDADVLKMHLANQKVFLKRHKIPFVEVPYRDALDQTKAVMQALKKFLNAPNSITNAVNHVKPNAIRFKKESLINGVH